MSDTEKKAKNRSSKRQTQILIGVALIILAAVFVYFAVSQPTVSVNENTTESTKPTEQIKLEDLIVDDPETTEQTQQAASSVQTTVKQTETTSKASAVTTTQPTTAQTTITTTNIAVSYPLNLNTCTAAELMTIDGIGEARASAIIAYRDYLGGYTDVEQLKNISGIGDGIFAKLEPYVTV